MDVAILLFVILLVLVGAANLALTIALSLAFLKSVEPPQKPPGGLQEVPNTQFPSN